MPNIGKAVGDFLGFDPTPGFNFGWTSHGGNVQPVVVGTGYNPRTGKTDARPAPSNKGGGNNNNKQTLQETSDASSGGGYGGGSGYSSPSYNPNVLAQYDQSIGTVNSAMGRLGNQLNIAKSNVGRRYDTSLNEINSAKSSAKGSYNTSTTQNKQDYRTDKNTINDSASAGLRGLLRTLGAYGAGGSSDAQYVAPQAVATEASQERAGAGQNYAQNQQSLDTNWNNFLREDENSRHKLTDWRSEQLNNAESQSESTRQDLLSKLAELTSAREAYRGGNGAAAAQPYIDQANAVASRIDQLARLDPTYTGKTATYDAPTLGSYTVNDGGAPTVGQNALEQSATPFLSMLLGDRREERTV